ncbi:MAG: hypothetical protein N3D16_07005 [Anaerolineales bacterium]|nr:hypothetical protein [Anaerolineales bacterium]
MQPSPPPNISQQPQKPSRQSRMRRILLLLILIALLILPLAQRPNPFVARLNEILEDYFLAFSPSLAQNSNPTATITPLGSEQIPSTLPIVTVSPTPTQAVATQAATPSSLQTIATPNTAGWLILSLLDRDFYHLFAYQPTQQNWLRLTAGQWDDLYPAVSPDGRWIAFTSNREGYWDLYVLSLQDGSITPLTRSPQYDGGPTWSPDGKWLAYESYVTDPQTQQRNLEILIQEFNPTGLQSPQVVQLTSLPGADFAPQWSPKGRQIAFISQQAGENDLWIADLDRIDDRYHNLSADTPSPVKALSWSADGRWLLWNVNNEGVQWIVRWDSTLPQSKPQKVMPGNQPVLSQDGKVLFSVLTTPHHAYLQVSAFEDRLYQMPLLLLPTEPKGMAWLPTDFTAPLAVGFQPVTGLEELLPPQEKEVQEPPQSSGRQRLKSLEGVKAPFAYLHEQVFEAFQALRQAIEERAGWDYLSRLENAYLPLSSPAFPGFYGEWLYTGRGIALEPAAMNAGWLVVVREEFGAELYWRLYLKTRFQDGSQGMPLRDLPFDLNARYRGDPLAYDRGGAWMSAAPDGYWIDLTELAQRYGWQRLPALPTWRTALSTARYAMLVKQDQIDWYAAMLELYPAEALYTATPLPSPTITPTRTTIPTRTPTLTKTPSPTPTARLTLTPALSPTISATP